MFIATCYCDWKCCKENNLPIDICQNSELANQDDIEISIFDICERYTFNSISSAIVIGGLEPFKQYNDIVCLIVALRNIYLIRDEIVIYTGYYPNEIKNEINELKKFSNIIIKFGRYIPNKAKKFDEILGIELASDNQFAERIS
jgi:hypothetical protein